jgi:broad specificity phosphatase PhoE
MLHLIRHAQSEMNVASAEWIRDHPGDLSIHWDLRLVDADLTSIGFTQVSDNRPLAQSLSLTKIYVSPLRRTLKTCQGLLDNHPDSPEVLVEPLMTEIITDCGDLSKGNFAWYRDFSHYDWSALESLNPKYWMFDVLSTPHMSEVERRAGRGEDLHRIAGEVMQRVAPEAFEGEQWARARVEAVKDMVMSDLEQGEEVALVGHSDFFKLFAKMFDPSHVLMLKNCQILSFPIALMDRSPHL